MADIDITINPRALEEVAREARKNGLEEFGPELVRICQSNSPVAEKNGGNLRRTHRFVRPQGEMRTAEAAAEAEYAAAVHEGWKQQRGEKVASYAGNPWMTRSIDQMAGG